MTDDHPCGNCKIHLRGVPKVNHPYCRNHCQKDPVFDDIRGTKNPAPNKVSEELCKIQDCNNPVKAKGMCSRHYQEDYKRIKKLEKQQKIKAKKLEREQVLEQEQLKKQEKKPMPDTSEETEEIETIENLLTQEEHAALAELAKKEMRPVKWQAAWILKQAIEKAA